MSFHAFVDESEPDVTDDPGMYLLAAAIVEADQLQATRDVVRALLLRGQRKLHWHGEDDGRRMLGVKTIATLPALHLVV